MAEFDIKLSLLYKNVLYSDANVGLQALAHHFKSAAQRVKPILRQELVRHLQQTVQLIASRNSASWPGGTTATTISRRSGAAMESLKKGIKITDGAYGPTGEMWGVFYLFVHEYGGTMRAKKSQFMTIPLPAALNSDGTPKHRTAREWNDTFVAESRAGNLIIFQRQGRLIVPLYVLRKEVRVPARLGLRQAQADAMDKYIWAVAKLVTEEVLG
jgi:hypothetical protein